MNRNTESVESLRSEETRGNPTNMNTGRPLYRVWSGNVLVKETESKPAAEKRAQSERKNYPRSKVTITTHP